MDDHRRWLIAPSVENAVLLDRQMEELESRIETNLQPYREQYGLLPTIPGVKEMTAATILAEIGPDMSQFETAKDLCRGSLGGGAQRDSMFQRKFHRWMRQLGEAKANVALAHCLLEGVYVLLKERQPYREPSQTDARTREGEVGEASHQATPATRSRRRSCE